MLEEQSCQKVSVIVPVRNEAGRVENVLNLLTQQTYPKERLEVLVVDGASEDDTKLVVENFIASSNFLRIRLLDNPKGQRAAGLNLGIKNSTGDVIVRVDARAIIPPDYICRCVRALMNTGADNVGGVQKAVADDSGGSTTQQAVSLALAYRFGVGDAQFRLGRKSGYVDSVYLGCFRREVFDEVGLFDEEAVVLSEDSDINYRIIKAGGKVYLDKDIVAYYYPRDNIRDLWKLYFRYGGARAGNFLKHGVLKWRQFAAPFFLLTLFVLAAFSFLSLLSLWILIVIVSLYFLADVFASVNLALKSGKIRLLPRLMLIFPCIHFAWGLGFLKRLFTRPEKGQFWGY